jgi:hypothetical protein
MNTGVWFAQGRYSPRAPEAGAPRAKGRLPRRPGGPRVVPGPRGARREGAGEDYMNKPIPIAVPSLPPRRRTLVHFSSSL